MIRLYLWILLLLPILAGCSRSPEVVKLSGGTMGTTWHVTYVVPAQAPPQGDIQAGIEARLEAVNASMSTYRTDSEISVVNGLPTGTWIGVSAPFYAVLSAALQVGSASEGAYDVTVGPLVDLWGFGPDPGPQAIPAPAQLESALAGVGQDHLRLDGDARSVMKLADVRLDFSSLAKGYAVDEIAHWLQQEGIGRYLVEVGGEMRVAGLSPRDDPWRVAIEQPDPGGRGVAAAIELTDVAVATSGDYRNFFELEGRRYSHSIDPRTGYPAAHELVSVTVVHPSAMLADAWATALTVLGPEQALAVAQQQGLAVYFIQRDGEDFAHRHTEAFRHYLSAPPR
jgi:thiamine biosynthesis lipoprotein